uniref:GDT1 family protein n=1 Tax=Compsopogon caeruleus TaxID=31354 RepID=A0A6T6BTE0_9RHOD
MFVSGSSRWSTGMIRRGIWMICVMVVVVAVVVVGVPLQQEVTEVVDEVIASLPSWIQEVLQGEGFFTATAQSLLMILVTELGDKTFFIAAVMAMKSSRAHVLIGALAALFLMTVLSAALGKAFPLLFDRHYTSIAASLLFTVFGIQMLRDWWRTRQDESEANEELEEVENQLMHDGDKGTPASERRAASNSVMLRVLARAFTLTFLAEWGDRSQIATIAFAASKDVYGVVLGGIVGHTLCTSLAVLGGRMLAARISERLVTLIGGVLFLSFAVLTSLGILE